ncbi:MAG: hypothetical protein F6J86_02370 [Symploca sp. SIO1B1]|nr:hypothetical protein [Symploca sp. SIO2D2]NER48918.1 hypothetical protein [Symploca sp. SIO1A3]NER92701.1 hypothetical protein [Symploca sp. SIO1B1]
MNLFGQADRNTPELEITDIAKGRGQKAEGRREEVSAFGIVLTALAIAIISNLVYAACRL